MPNSFYRFSNAWNAGFYPDNQITSNQLNDIYVTIGAWLPGYFPGKTFIELKNAVKAQVAPFNQFPVLGNFEVIVTTAPDPPFVDYYIYIRNVDLYKIDNNQTLIIVGQYNASNNLIVTCSLTSFTPGAYTGTFNSALVDAENNGVNSLKIANDYGSAIFPLYYSYDSITGIATSGLARASTLQLDGSGNISRLPADTLPKQNIRKFNLAALSAEDKFVITFLERIISTSIADTDYLVIQDTFNDYVMPDGWSKSFTYTASSYDRIQVTVTSLNDREFTMIGRLDGNWTWQRFVKDNAPVPTGDFIASYSSNTPLPYLPLSGSSYVYFEAYYDFDLCDFTSDCYVSDEFYPMPAIPGDTFQFNVPSDTGNLTGLISTSVGLFEEDGGFVQKIGEAKRDCCFQAYLPYSIADGGEPFFEDWITFVDDYLVTTPLQFFFSNQTENYTGTSAGTQVGDDLTIVAATLPAGTVTTYDKQDFIDAVVALSWPAGIVVSGDIVNFNGNEVVQLNFCNYVAADYPSIQTKSLAFETPVYFNYIESLCCNPQQFQASCTIPAVADGCYRLGLYNLQETGGGSTCELTFEYTIDSPEAYIDYINANYSGEFYVLALFDGVNYSQINQIQVPSIVPPSPGFVLQDIIDFANGIPGMVCTYNEITAYLTFNWTVTVDCNVEYTFRNVIMDIEGNVLEGLFSTAGQTCECEIVDLNAYSLYSLSNIIKIDRADCFSTMIDFWSDDNTMAEGFEYFNGWKQRVRLGINGGGAKPVLEESLYRQSNGVHKRPQNKQDLSLDLHTDFLDQETQLALVDATRHAYLVWDNKPIFVKGDIDVATIQDFTTQSSFETLAQVKFQALLQGFQPRNSSCLTC